MVILIIGIVLFIICIVLWWIFQVTEFFMLGVLLFSIGITVPYFHGIDHCTQSNTLKEYEVCQYNGELCYVAENDVIQKVKLDGAKSSKDSDIHVILVEYKTKPSIWYFSYSYSRIEVSVPLDCK